MPSTRDIRRRIKSVKNTAQITKAMQMVAASKMRKAQQAALAGRPYANLMNKVLAALVAATQGFQPSLSGRARGHAPLRHPGQHRQGPVRRPQQQPDARGGQVRAGDRIHRRRAQRPRSFWRAPSAALAAEFTFKDAPLFGEARAISKFAQDLFLKGEVDRVDIVYTQVHLHLGPKARSAPTPAHRRNPACHRRHGCASRKCAVPPAAGGGEFLFEPGQEQVLGALLPHSLNFQIYQILLEAKASEHSARMVAMKNATDNAKQFIKDLTLEYNKLRQANITKELLEIASAAMAMG